jgi:hypothetical protein
MIKVSSKALLVNKTRPMTEMTARRDEPAIRGYRGAITTWRRIGGSPNQARSAATVGCIVRYNDAPFGARRHAVIALLVVLVVLAAGTGWKLTDHSPPAHHGPHALSSHSLNDSAAVVEHPHVQDGSVAVTPVAFAEAALPRSVTLLAAIGLVAVIGVAFLRLATGASSVIRGPPRWGSCLVAGQQLLLRLCIARR